MLKQVYVSFFLFLFVFRYVLKLDQILLSRSDSCTLLLYLSALRVILMFLKFFLLQLAFFIIYFLNFYFKRRELGIFSITQVLVYKYLGKLKKNLVRGFFLPFED